MHHLVYVSSATTLMPKVELLAILEKSRRNNTRLGITGLLLYKDGNIIQVLEGESQAIHALYEKIGQDPRHTGALVLLDEPIAERSFPDWSMGFRDLDSAEVRELSGFSEFMNTPLTELKDASRSRKLLKIFRSRM